MKTIKKAFNKKIVATILMLTLVCPMFIALSGQAKTSKYTIYKGKTETIKLIGLSKTAKVTWKLGNKKVAKIIKKGSEGTVRYAKVKGLKAGKTSLKVSYKDGNRKVKLNYVINVKNNKMNKSDNNSNNEPKVKKGTEESKSDTGLTTPTAVPTSTTGRSIKDEPTQKPTIVPVPEKTPKPTGALHTPVPLSIPDSVDIPLTKDNQYIMNDYDVAKLTFNDDGTLTIVFDQQYSAVSFCLPDTAETFYSKYNQVTIEYSSSGNNLNYALYDSKFQYGIHYDDGYEDPSKHVNWDQQITVGSNQTKTFFAESYFAGGCIRGIEIFNPFDPLERGVTSITINKITFKVDNDSAKTPNSNIKDVFSDYPEHMPGEILIGFNEPTDEETLVALLNGEETEKIEDFYKSMYDYMKDNENANKESLEKFKQKIGTKYYVILNDKSDSTLFRVIESLNSSPLVKYAEVNAIAYPD